MDRMQKLLSMLRPLCRRLSLSRNTVILLVELASFAVLLAGVAGFDWRAACIFGGGLVLLVSLAASARRPSRTPQ